MTTPPNIPENRDMRVYVTNQLGLGTLIVGVALGVFFGGVLTAFIAAMLLT